MDLGGSGAGGGCVEEGQGWEGGGSGKWREGIVGRGLEGRKGAEGSGRGGGRLRASLG